MLSNRRLIRKLAVDPLFALVVAGRLSKIKWDASEMQELFAFSFNEAKIKAVSTESLVIGRSVGGVGLGKGGQPKAKPRYHEMLFNRGMCLGYVRIA